MTAAPQPLEQPELLSWDEIKARYPEQYVCLVDIERPRPMSGALEPVAARVVGHGENKDAALAAYRSLGVKYECFSIRFTGEVDELVWIRPTLIIDDVAREILDEVPEFYPSRR